MQQEQEQQTEEQTRGRERAMEEPQQTEWTGNAAQDPNRFKNDTERFNARNHPNMPDPGDFKDWMVVSPNSMVELFATGATIEDTVCPANPTGPTNISYWGETPPHSAEMIAAATPAEDTYVQQERADNLTPEMQEIEDAHRPHIVALFAGEPQDPELFAPALGGMQPEAAGTEDVLTMEYEPSGEAAPVEIPIAVSAGVDDYTVNPNATHPSNPDAPEGTPQDADEGDEGHDEHEGYGGYEGYASDEGREVDAADDKGGDKPRKPSKPKGSKVNKKKAKRSKQGGKK